MRFVVPDLADPMKHPKAVRRAVAQRQQAVRDAFRDHDARVRPLLPPSLQQLQERDLNDGLIRSVRIDPRRRTLQLCLLCGDLQQGYADLTLNYTDIDLTGQETSLLCYIAWDESSEIYWDEVDLKETEPSRFIHRILWQTGTVTSREPAGADCYTLYTLRPEIELRFGGFEMVVRPRRNRHLVRPENVVTIVRDPDRIDGMDDHPETSSG